MNKENYYAIIDINGGSDKHLWTLTGEQLNEITRLMISMGDPESADLGVSIGRALRAVSA